MKKKLLLLCILTLSALGVRADRLLTSLYTRQVLEASIVQPQQFAPVPRAASPFWRQTVSVYMRHSYINNGRGYLGKPWMPIPPSVFREYSLNGNRTNYESRSFALRKQLACMVMAEIMQDSGHFIDDIVKGLRFFQQEVWWGVPAHYPKPLPDADLQEVDLFNAETANLLVWTCYMLEDRLKTKDPRICQDIKNEIRRRILIPARTTDYFWKRHSWNHNTWTCANWLSCILFCEEDRQQQISDILQVLKSLDVFIDGYPADGGCDEGPNYWDRATGSLFECMQLLSLASDGKVTLPVTDKIKAMSSYIYKMYIGNGYYVNFADCNSRMTPNINILYPLGSAINDQIMMRHAAFIAEKNEYFAHPWTLFNPSGVFPSVSRELCFLRLLPAFLKETAEEAHPITARLTESQIFTARSGDNGTNDLFVAAKGGHNDENHNHNDIGNFIVYCHSEPIIIDIGVGTYTAQTFGNGRYDLLYCRSAYHNVPLINGYEQQAGKQYKAKNVRYSDDNQETTFCLDLSDAYPLEACVRKWDRSIVVNKEHGITITEDYWLSQYIQLTAITLICCGEVSNNGDNKIIINNGISQCLLTFDDRQLSAHIEKIVYHDPAIQNTWGDKDLHLIRLNILSRKMRGKISYTITKP